MSIIGVVITLVVIGVLLWLLNNYAAEFIDGKILRIINVVVVILVVLWLLQVFFGVLGAFGPLNQPIRPIR